MNEKVRVLGEEVLSNNWGLVKKTTMELQRRNGDCSRGPSVFSGMAKALATPAKVACTPDFSTQIQMKMPIKI